MWFDEKKDTGEPALLASYIYEHRLATKFKKFLFTKSPGLRESNTKESIRVSVTDQLKKKMAVPEKSKICIKVPNHGAETCTKVDRKAF